MSNVRDVKLKKVTVDLDKERHLVYDLNAYAELEDKYGSVEVAMTKLQEGSIKTLRFILWAGLVHEEEELTEKYVGKLIGMGELDMITKAIAGALSESTPKEDESPVGNK